jgi:hypothetical protein
MLKKVVLCLALATTSTTTAYSQPKDVVAQGNPAGEVLNNVEVIDDPFSVSALYQLTIVDQRAADDGERLRAWIIVSVDRQTGTRIWALSGFIFYRGDWRFYNSARLLGGRTLDLTPGSRDVVTCRSEPCLLSEGFTAFLDDSAISEARRSGLLAVQIGGQRGGRFELRITQADLRALEASIAAHPPARQ